MAPDLPAAAGPFGKNLGQAGLQGLVKTAILHYIKIYSGRLTQW
jgi:hypothetical protein